jgi:hypothetical protein
VIVSHTTKRFRKAFSILPDHVKEQAKNAYRQFREDPYHPSLHFKRVHQEKPVYSARISDNYRAVGIKKGDTLIWFWAGLHSDYEKLLHRL